MQNKSFIRSIFRNGPSDLQIRKPAVLPFGNGVNRLSLPVFSGSDSSSGTTAPAFPSIRAIRSIRSNNSNVKMLINGVSIEIDTAISEEFLGKLIKAVCHA